MKPAPSRDVVSTTLAARMLGVSAQSVKSYVKAGKLEGFTLPGGYYRIYRDSIDRWMRYNAPPDLDSSPY